MAHTAHKTQLQKKQHFDSEDVLDKKIEQLAKLIMESKHFIAFTGAGISTACGIPDFRSGVNTVLKTGPGAWEKKAQKINNGPNKNIIEMAKALPSFTHMTFVKLQQMGLLKYLVSQNTDGLHLRSGFNPKKLAQLHGNRCLQKCKKCKSQFLRDFRTRESQKVHEHKTSRKCQKCGQYLYDSIINFGQNLPQYEIDQSFQQAQKSDLCLAMGSSLTVTPAADVPKLVGKNGKLIIVNLQSTALDKYAYMRIDGLCDNVMKKLAEKMKIKVENFILQRMINFQINKNQQMEFRGIDLRGVPFSFIKQCHIAYNAEKAFKPIKCQSYRPYKVNFGHNKSVRIKLQFYKFLGEPNYELQFEKQPQGVLKLQYNPQLKQWSKPDWIKLQE